MENIRLANGYEVPARGYGVYQVSKEDMQKSHDYFFCHFRNPGQVLTE